MILQKEFLLRARSRGIHLVTDEVLENLGKLPQTGLLNLFIKHTSCALAVNENADPDVRLDMAAFFDHLVKERESYYRHTLEGEDDMPAHLKSILAGVSITVPLTGGGLNLGMWQGIYLCEFRNEGGSRRVVATMCY